MEEVVDTLNKLFDEDPNNLDNLIKLRDKISNEKSVLESSISLTSEQVPSDAANILKEVEECCQSLKELTDEILDYEQDVELHETKITKVHDVTKDCMDKICALEKTKAYLLTLKKIEGISNCIETSLGDRNRRCVSEYMNLCSLSNKIAGSSAENLVKYLKETIRYWHAILKERYTKEYEDVIKSLKWPFLGVSTVPTPSIDLLSKFQILTETLIQIDQSASSRESSVPSSTAMSTTPLSLPISLLVRPLKKRFVYHFSGNKKTNQNDKPEWFFTQILTWIKNHQDFIGKHVQPVYDRIQPSSLVAKVEFTRGLVQLTMEKLHWDLPQLRFDDGLFSHTVDEALGFDRELREGYGYPENQPSVLLVLTQADNFLKWINLEKKYSLEKLDQIMQSERAFQRTSDVEDAEYTTECVDKFLILLSTLTDRYSTLPEPGHKLEFLQLQQDLLDDFRVRLLQLVREEYPNDLFNSNVPAILNSIKCLSTILEEWATMPLFLQLNFFKSQLAAAEARSNDSSLSPDESFNVFSNILGMFANMQEILLGRLVEGILLEVKVRSRDYRKDKWHKMIRDGGVTPSAIPLFEVLTKQLRVWHESLTPSIRKPALPLLAREIDTYLFEELVSERFFSSDGAAQLAFDVERILLPLFGQYMSKPGVHFKLLSDSVTLLALPLGSAMLLQSSLAGEDDDHGSTVALEDMKVFTLKPSEVLKVLARRVDLMEGNRAFRDR